MPTFSPNSTDVGHCHPDGGKFVARYAYPELQVGPASMCINEAATARSGVYPMKIDPVYASVVPDLPATGRPPRSPRYSFTGPRRRSVIRYPSSGLITWTRGALGSKASNTVPSASTTFKTG